MKRCYSVRFDDVCPTMEREKFNAICSILEEKGAFPLLGVVPDNKDKKLIKVEEDADFWEEIKILQKKGYAIAQHGTFHQYITKKGGILNINKRSEFAGLSYDEQYKKLKKGKEILIEHGIETDIFMAPAHSYDINTIKAAKSLGFKYFTDGYTNYPYKIEEILFLPCWTSKYRKRGFLNTICIHVNNLTTSEYNCLKRDFTEKELLSYSDFLELCKTKCKGRQKIQEIGKTLALKIKRLIY